MSDWFGRLNELKWPLHWIVKRSQAIQGTKSNRLGIVVRDRNRLLDSMKHGLDGLLEVFVIHFVRSLPIRQ